MTDKVYRLPAWFISLHHKQVEAAKMGMKITPLKSRSGGLIFIQNFINAQEIKEI